MNGLVSAPSLDATLHHALAGRVVRAEHVRDTALASVFRARSPEDRVFSLHVVSPPLLALVRDHAAARDALRSLPTMPGLSLPVIEWVALADGHLCFATAWQDSVPLGATVRPYSAGPRLSEAARELCRELAAAHARGVPHGAIAPASLSFLPGEGRFRLDDVGVLAALIAGGAAADEVLASSPAGGYASPELLARARAARLDERADIFSLGASLYEILTGCQPFGGRTTSTLMASVLVDSRTGELHGHALSDAVDALLRAIEKEPDDRWPTLAEFGDAFAGGRHGTARGAARRAPRRPWWRFWR